MITKKKVGQQTTMTRQFPKGGTNVKIRDVANQVDLLKAMVEEHAAQIKRLTEATAKARCEALKRQNEQPTARRRLKATNEKLQPNNKQKTTARYKIHR